MVSSVKVAHFRFYAELNDFLPPEKRRGAFRYALSGAQPVKHLIEALGVPHTEVDLVLVNGDSSGFDRIIRDGDRVSVYPVFEAFDIAAVSRVRPRPLRRTRFAADAHLARLAAYLRMLGFDTVCDPGLDDAALTELAARERRIVLTRDRGLLKRRAVTHGYFVRQTAPRLQLAEAVGRFDLAGSITPFTRCMKCNGELQAVTGAEVADKVPPRSRRHASHFRACRACGRVFWDGSHYRRMQLLITQVTGREPDGVPGTDQATPLDSQLHRAAGRGAETQPDS